jgi:hypothetical protein
MKFARHALLLIGTAALTGCAGGGLDPIAPSGTIALEGADPIVQKAPATGQISVYDLTTEQLLYSGLIHKDQVLSVDPVAKNVSIDGKVANSKPLYGGDSLKIDFTEDK